MRRLVVLTLVVAMTPALAHATTSPLTFAGGSSWYGGPADSGDNNITASGIPNSVPGFASRFVPFGWWFLVTAQNGHRALGESVDRGPASFTGRIIDLDYTLVGRLGYGPGPYYFNYDNGHVTATRILPGARYPSCGWWARDVFRQLQRIHGRKYPGRTDCLTGGHAKALHRWQRRHHLGDGWRSTVGFRTYRLLYRAG